MQELKDIQQGVGTRDDRQLYSNDENYEDSSKKWQYTQSGLAESWCVAGEEEEWSNQDKTSEFDKLIASISVNPNPNM